jgi:hypothetical protein
MTIHRRIRNRLAFIVAPIVVGGLSLAAVALADENVADGDGLVPVTNQNMSFGSVNCGVATDKTALLAIQRTQGGANAFANSSTVSVSVVSVTGAGLSATMTDSTINLPSTWIAAPTNTMSSDTASSKVTINSTTPGVGAGTIVYRATGVNSSNGNQLIREDTMQVSWNTGTCNTAPTAPGKPALAAGSNTPNQGVFDLTWAASTDAESNPITYRLEHRDANDSAYSLGTGADTLGSNSFSFTAAAKENEGTWTYQVRASDGSLNSNFSPASDPIKVDQSPPTAPNASTGRSPEDSSGNWFRDTVTVSYSGSTDPNLADGSAGSGVASHSASQTFNSSGIHDYSGKATDNAGNESNATTGQVKVDATDPQVQITGCPTGLVAQNSSQSIIVSASDAHSGLATDPTGSVPLDTSAPGEHTKTVTAVDKVGRSQSASCTYTVNSPPSTPGKPTLAGGSSTPNQGAFGLEWDASTDPDNNLDHYELQHKDADDADYSNVSGATNLSNPSFAFSSGSPEDEGTWTYKAKAVDALGAESGLSDASNEIKVDRTKPNAPTLSFTSGQPPPANVAGVDWYKDSASIDVADNGDPNLPDGSVGSGVDSTSFTSPFTVSTNGTSTASKTVKDKVGNESAAGQLTVNVDAASPTVAISGCPTADVIKGSSHSLTVSAQDGESGLAADPSGTVALDTSSIGQQSKTVTATDNVGHQTSVTCSYRVIWDWSGFYRPVDNKDVNGDYILNAAKAGSAVPIKFSLDGPPVPGSNTGQGLNVFEAGYPKSQVIACDSDAEVDGIEETATAGNSALTYDPVADQYVYVWKTLKEWGGKGCRQLVLKLADGTVQRANFKFTK